jgi:hypothetical protein
MTADATKLKFFTAYEKVLHNGIYVRRDIAVKAIEDAVLLIDYDTDDRAEYILNKAIETIDKNEKKVSNKKFYTRDEISKEFNLLSEKDKIEIMWDVLDVKDLYNGRSHFSCLALAMGYEEDNDTYFKKTLN